MVFIPERILVNAKMSIANLGEDCIDIVIGDTTCILSSLFLPSVFSFLANFVS